MELQVIPQPDQSYDLVKYFSEIHQEHVSEQAIVLTHQNKTLVILNQESELYWAEVPEHSFFGVDLTLLKNPTSIVDYVSEPVIDANTIGTREILLVKHKEKFFLMRNCFFSNEILNDPLTEMPYEVNSIAEAIQATRPQDATQDTPNIALKWYVMPQEPKGNMVYLLNDSDLKLPSFNIDSEPWNYIVEAKQILISEAGDIYAFKGSLNYYFEFLKFDGWVQLKENNQALRIKKTADKYLGEKWWNQPIELLQHKSPAQVCKEGRLDFVQNIVQRICHRQLLRVPTP